MRKFENRGRVCTTWVEYTRTCMNEINQYKNSIKKDPFNKHCLLWIDYAFAVVMLIPLTGVIAFLFWAFYHAVTIGPRK